MIQNKHVAFISAALSVLMWSKSLLGIAPGVHLQFNIGRRVIPIKGVFIAEEELEVTERFGGTGVLWKSTGLYGLTKHIGFRLFIPVFLKRRVGSAVSRGLSDISLEAIFIRFFKPYNATLLSAGFFAPTGDSTVTPALGTGNYNLLLTAQWIHSSPDWYWSFLLRPIVSFKRKGVNAGSVLNFEYLFGPKFTLKHANLPMAVLLEMDGAWRKPARVNGVIVPNTGGTVVIVGPLVSVRTRRMILQGRVQFPILQRFSGLQPKVNYLAALTMQYYF